MGGFTSVATARAPRGPLRSTFYTRSPKTQIALTARGSYGAYGTGSANGCGPRPRGCGTCGATYCRSCRPGRGRARGFLG